MKAILSAWLVLVIVNPLSALAQNDSHTEEHFGVLVWPMEAATSGIKAC